MRYRRSPRLKERIKKAISDKFQQFSCRYLNRHEWPKYWLWAELDYACRKCKHCPKVSWGCTQEYYDEFKSVLKEKYKIISRS